MGRSSPARATSAALRVSPRLAAARHAGLQLRMAEEGDGDAGDLVKIPDAGDLAKIPENVPAELVQQNQDLTRGVEQLLAGFAMIQSGLGVTASAAAQDAQKKVGEGFSQASGSLEDAQKQFEEGLSVASGSDYAKSVSSSLDYAKGGFDQASSDLNPTPRPKTLP